MLPKSCPDSSDVATGIAISIVLMVAVDTSELRLSGPVSPRAVATPATRFAGAAGVNPDHGDAHPVGLIAREVNQLAERPTGHHGFSLIH